MFYRKELGKLAKRILTRELKDKILESVLGWQSLMIKSLALAAITPPKVSPKGAEIIREVDGKITNIPKQCTKKGPIICVHYLKGYCLNDEVCNG